MIRFRKAVLIIHGFAGGTYDQEELANFLELNLRLDVYSFTLPGHDIKSKEKATCSSWINESERQLKFLINAGYRTIYLIGHSMGGVIACHLASKYKQVKKVVLAAPAFSHFAAKEEGGIFGAIGKGPDILKSYGTDDFLTRVRKLPISAVGEFFKLVEKYQNTPVTLSVPVMILHGTNDQIVPIASSLNVYNELSIRRKKLIKVKGYYHDLFKGKKVNLLCEEIEKFLVAKKNGIKPEIIEL